MQSSKLLTLLNSLSTREMKSLNTFLGAPFHNTNQDIVRFFALLINHHNDFTSKDISKASIHRRLFPNTVYNDKRMRYLMTELLELTQDFLLVQRIKKKDANMSMILLEEFSERNVEKSYKQLYKKINTGFIKKRGHDEVFFFNYIHLAQIDEHGLRQQNPIYSGHNTQQKSDHLNRYFVLKKLKYACNLLNRQALRKEHHTLDFPENWIAWIEKNNFFGEAIIQCYLAVFLALKAPEKPAYFEQLGHLLHEEKLSVSQKDLKDLFLYAINYCAQRIREGRTEYVEKALSLYLEGIKTTALLEGGYFSPQSFNNVVKLALRLEKYEWIATFIESYKHFLPPTSRENTLRYNLAELNCYKKDFNTALELLSKVEFINLSYQLGSRIMLSKIYYELKEEKALLSLISAFMMFLKRNKQISDPIKKTCLNFCDLLFLIIRGKVKSAETKINTTSLLTDRDWLLEKVAEIKNK